VVHADRDGQWSEREQDSEPPSGRSPQPVQEWDCALRIDDVTDVNPLKGDGHKLTAQMPGAHISLNEWVERVCQDNRGMKMEIPNAL